MLVLRAMDPIGIVTHFPNNQGVGDAGNEALMLLAAYTLPLTSGIFMVALLTITGYFSTKNTPETMVIIAVILLITGIISNVCRLGLSPAFSTTWPSGPIYLALPLYVLSAYFTTYSTPLAICALVIGTTAAIHFERLLKPVNTTGA